MTGFMIAMMLMGNQPPVDDIEAVEVPAPILDLTEGEIFTAKGLIIADPRYSQMYYTPRMMAAAKKAAIELEILDAREVYFFRLEDEFEIDIKAMSRRFKEFLDTPKVADVINTLPDLDGLNSALSFNREFLKNMKVRARFETDRTAEFEQVIKETEYLHNVYDCLRDIKCPYYYVYNQRLAIKKLICLVGEENFEKRKFPPCVPIWYFYEP